MQRARLGNRQVLCLSGEDRLTFLQGLVTNDLASAKAPALIWAALLTPQGRYTSDLFIWPESDKLYLDVYSAHVAELIKQLRRYRLRADVRLDETDLAVYAFWEDPPLMTVETPPKEPARRDPRWAKAGWRLICERMENEGNDNVEGYDLHRLKLGLPDPVDCVQNKTLPLEANFDLLHGISWTKGCYLGQEVTARTHYRGLVKKRLVSVRSVEPLPKIGRPILYQEKKIGELRSSVGNQGLALIRREYWNLGSSSTDAKKLNEGEDTLFCDNIAVQIDLPEWFQDA